MEKPVNIKKITIKTLSILTLGFCALFINMKQAEACCSCPASVEATEFAQWDLAEDGKTGTVPMVNRHVTKEFVEHRKWFIDVFWEEHVLKAMLMMSDQLTAVAMQQAMIFGTFLDAKHQMETQRLFQTIQARAHKDYHPSVGMCEFGSNVKSLAASERIGEVSAVALAETALDRHLGNTSSSGTSPDDDFKARRDLYVSDFCNKADNNGNLELLCTGSPDYKRMNNDINFAKILDHATETKINFTDANLEDDEKDVIALGQNLYGHNVFTRPNGDKFELLDPEDPPAIREAYLDTRAVIAKRSVAENSFNAIVGLKSEGTDGSKDFLTGILKDLDIPPTDIAKILGDKPSYDTQMNILTKKIYQNPNFYTNLYDKPANVARKNVAMQAIGLMQKFDMFKSHLRSEASLSVLLELAVVDLQREIENQTNTQRGDTKKAD